MLKLAAPIIAPSIAKLINYSFNTASFPQHWKTAKVFALFKGGDSEDLNNYRPISVLPVLSKVIERHVHDSLSSYLCENNLIYSKQSGFQKLHTTETALIRVIDDLLLMILILLQRPSTWLHVSSANTDLYADIKTLTCSIKLMDMHRLQTSLNAVVSETFHWATAKKLPLNEKKTKVLTICGKRLSNRIRNEIVISVNGSQLENIQCAKLLGLEIDKELTFHSHVDKLYKKLSQRIGILKKIRHCLQIKHMVIFYNAIIRPVMDYVSVIWSNCDKHCLHRVLKLQRGLQE